MDAGKVHETMIEKDADKMVLLLLSDQMHVTKKVKGDETKTEGTQQLNTDEKKMAESSQKKDNQPKQSMDADKVNETMIEKDPETMIEKEAPATLAEAPAEDNQPEQSMDADKVNEMMTTDDKKMAENDSSQKKEIGEAEFQEVFKDVWEMEKDGLFALAREDVRLQMLKDAWWKRPNQMNFKQFKNQDPLWSNCLRLFPSKTYTSYKRFVLHQWADKHNIGCETHYPTQNKHPKDQDMVMLFWPKITAFEWSRFDEWVRQGASAASTSGADSTSGAAS